MFSNKVKKQKSIYANDNKLAFSLTTSGINTKTMKTETIASDHDLLTLRVFKSIIRSSGPSQERWELTIRNQYNSQLAHITTDGNFARFLELKTGMAIEDLLTEYGRSEVKNLSSRHFGC